MSMVSGSDSAFKEPLVIDSGLSLINIFSLLLVAFIIVPVYLAERERQTLVAALSFNVSRAQYLWGLWAGSAAALTVNYLAMTMMLMINLLVLKIPITVGIFRQLFLNFCEILTLGSFAITFSLFFSYVVAIMLTGTFYILGHMTTSLQMALQEWEGSVVARIIDYTRLLVPDFSLFNLKDIIIKNTTIPATYELIALIYAIAMIFIAIEIGRYKLNRENLL
jgi:ABC-type transport system involved in multi-copper enzyme maturation permease subunit